MDGFLPNILKYLILFANLVLFLAGIVVFGISIWAVADSPEFLSLFEKAKDVVGDEADGLSLNIYSTTTYIFITVSAVVVIVSFFGCCGAWKESKCMLATYFTFILILFILLLTGGILAYSGDLKENIKKPLLKSVAKYNDQATAAKDKAYKDAWNTIMKDMKCCGVNNALDWKNATSGWANGINKPAGCCGWRVVDGKASDISKEASAVTACQQAAVDTAQLTNTYYWDGCFSKFEDKVEKNKSVVVWGTSIGAVVIVLTLLVTLGLCMMVD